MAISKMSLCTLPGRLCRFTKGQETLSAACPHGLPGLGRVRAAVPRGWVRLRQPRTAALAIGVLTQDRSEEQEGEAIEHGQLSWQTQSLLQSKTSALGRFPLTRHSHFLTKARVHQDKKMSSYRTRGRSAKRGPLWTLFSCSNNPASNPSAGSPKFQESPMPRFPSARPPSASLPPVPALPQRCVPGFLEKKAIPCRTHPHLLDRWFYSSVPVVGKHDPSPS